MLLVRQVLQAKYGRGDELVALFQEMRGQTENAPSATLGASWCVYGVSEQ